jgi:hypothetical protein
MCITKNQYSRKLLMKQNKFSEKLFISTKKMFPAGIDLNIILSIAYRIAMASEKSVVKQIH